MGKMTRNSDLVETGVDEFKKPVPVKVKKAPAKKAPRRKAKK